MLTSLLRVEVVEGVATLTLEREAALFAAACADEDTREDARAFLEKRPARFRGR